MRRGQILSSLFGVVIALALAACTERAGTRTGPTVARDSVAPGVVRVTTDAPLDSVWELVEQQRYGGAEGSGSEFVDPQGIDVDDNGRLYVADQKPTTIKVYGPDGALVRTIGKEGSGPGEFRIAFFAVRGGHLAVHDPMQARTTLFDTAGTYVRSWRTFCCYWQRIAIDREQRVVIPAWLPPEPGQRERGTPYARYRLDGTPLDTLWVEQTQGDNLWTFTRTQKNGQVLPFMKVTIPYTPEVLHTHHPDGGFVRGWNGEFAIKRSPNGTDSSLIMSKRWAPELLSDALRTTAHADILKNAIDQIGEVARTMAKLEDVPKTTPAFDRLVVDDAGNTWAQRTAASDSSATVFDVFAPTGEWQAVAQLPTALDKWGPMYIGRGILFARTEDDAGRPVIVRYGIRTTAGSTDARR